MEKLHLTERGYAFPMQLWPQTWYKSLRVKEIPVRWSHTTTPIVISAACLTTPATA